MWGLFWALFNFACAFGNLAFFADSTINFITGLINLVLGVVVLVVWLGNRR